MKNQVFPNHDLKSNYIVSLPIFLQVMNEILILVVIVFNPLKMFMIKIG